MWQIMLAVSRRVEENEVVPEIDLELLFKPLQSVAMSPLEPNFNLDSRDHYNSQVESSFQSER
jgi:hypothetical protein